MQTRIVDPMKAQGLPISNKRTVQAGEFELGYFYTWVVSPWLNDANSGLFVVERREGEGRRTLRFSHPFCFIIQSISYPAYTLKWKIYEYISVCNERCLIILVETGCFLHFFFLLSIFPSLPPPVFVSFPYRSRHGSCRWSGPQPIGC